MLCDQCGIEMNRIEPKRDRDGEVIYAWRGWGSAFKDMYRCPKCLHTKLEF